MDRRYTTAIVRVFEGGGTVFVILAVFELLKPGLVTRTVDLLWFAGALIVLGVVIQFRKIKE
jgi:hypothetical protein